MEGDFLGLGFFSGLWRKKNYYLEFSNYISISLAAKEWKTCLDSSL